MKVQRGLVGQILGKVFGKENRRFSSHCFLNLLTSQLWNMMKTQGVTVN